MTSKQLLNKRTIHIVYSLSLLILLAFVSEVSSQQAIFVTEETKLQASDPGEPWDMTGFGSSVAISGDTIVVGAPEDGSLTGSVYIYQLVKGAWQETKLQASDGAGEDEFGRSVAISGDTVVVGAWLDDDNGGNSGSAYVYHFDGKNWIETKLTASDGEQNDFFGSSVAISGDTIVVGTGGLWGQGVGAYIYQLVKGAWQETKLQASDGAGEDEFGRSVAISGETIVVGAPLDSDNGDYSGSAYVYQFDGSSWIETKLLASDGDVYNGFGRSVAISGETIVVGASDQVTGQSYGAYIYRFDGVFWIEETKLLASDGQHGHVGRRVAINNDIVVTQNYSSYLYRFDGSSWIETKLIVSGEGGYDMGIAVADDVAALGKDNSVGLFNADQDGLMHVPKEHATLDDAMRRALQGSEIILSPGTYTGTGDSVIDTFGKTLTIRSSDGPENTIIDGEGVRRGIACYNEETSTGMPVVTIEGLTFTNGYTDEGAGLVSVGGITAISNCNFAMNNAFFGGAVNIIDPEAGSSITDTRFEQNTANFGGGIYLNECANDVLISSCVFYDNTANFGGGVHLNECVSGVTIRSCGFYDNMATYGGGMYNLRGFMVIDDIRMSGNAAYEGGGIFELESISSISNSWFGANVADVGGSSINNHVSYSDISDSMFCSPGIDGHITGGWGDLGGNVFSDNCDDCNGNGYPDIIEIKLDPSLDCNGNLVIDWCEIKDGWVADCDGNGTPDSCDLVDYPSLDCDANSVMDYCEINDGSADDCNTNGLPDSCDIANGTSLDIDVNDIPDECEDCNGNEVPDGMDLADCDGSPWCSDCNTNGELDVCDIASGESNDQNENGIPDECECLADINGDGSVNVVELLTVIDQWGETDSLADLNFDGIVDVSDLLIVIGNWGECE